MYITHMVKINQCKWIYSEKDSSLQVTSVYQGPCTFLKGPHIAYTLIFGYILFFIFYLTTIVFLCFQSTHNIFPLFFLPYVPLLR